MLFTIYDNGQLHASKTSKLRCWPNVSSCLSDTRRIIPEFLEAQSNFIEQLIMIFLEDPHLLTVAADGIRNERTAEVYFSRVYIIF